MERCSPRLEVKESGKKIKNGKGGNQRWNRKVFGWVDQHIIALENRLVVLEDRIQTGCELVEHEFLSNKQELEI